MLQITDLTVEFAGTRVVDGITFSLDAGSTLGLVGESGCGKSAAALSIVGLLPPPGRVTGGSIVFDGEDLLDLDDTGLQQLRGARIGFIFQDPGAALNPSFTIGDQIAEAMSVHGVARGAEARQRAVDLLERVRIPEPLRRARDYPHQLSGGMRQRAVIAAALACRPSLLIADEPTTALDVTTQADILDLLRDMRREFNLAVLLISHDLGVVAGLADRIAVMYAGRIVESGPARGVLADPAHPYTRGLLASVPGRAPGARLPAIPGTVPAPGFLPPGCAFEPRCRERIDECDTVHPSARPYAPGHSAECLLLLPEEP
jgi:oligopeptide/dipeptide ABC transporter ATP-binding protein